MDRRDETVRKAKLFPNNMAVPSNVSTWFIPSAICARLVLHGSERKAVLRAVGYNLLFRFDHSTSSKNRARLMQHDVAKLLFGQVVAQA
jgi:hypothetical protein